MSRQQQQLENLTLRLESANASLKMEQATRMLAVREAQIKAREEYEAQIRSYEGLPSRNEQLQNDVEALDSRYTSLRVEHATLQDAVKVQEAANIQLVRNTQQAEERRDFFQSESDYFRKRVEQLKEQIAHLVDTDQRRQALYDELYAENKLLREGPEQDG